MCMTYFFARYIQLFSVTCFSFYKSNLGLPNYYSSNKAEKKILFFYNNW